MPFRMVTKFGKRKIKDIPLESEEDVTYQDEKINLFDAVNSVIKNRRSARKYNKRDVDMELIMKVIESATYAPSSGNYQPWEFIVVKNPEIKKHLVEACYNQNWMLDAPVFIIACTNCRLAGAVYGERGLKLYGIQAVAAAVENMLLTAEALGLATCWVGTFAELMVSRFLECPEYIRPCAIITLGYSDEKPSMPKRQYMEEFVHIGKFGNTLHMQYVKKEKKPTYMKFRG